MCRLHLGNILSANKWVLLKNYLNLIKMKMKLNKVDVISNNLTSKCLTSLIIFFTNFNSYFYKVH